MGAGFPGFNIKVKKSKTQSTLEGACTVDFFGYTFDQNLEVFVKYNKGADLSFRNTMCFTQKMTPTE